MLEIKFAIQRDTEGVCGFSLRAEPETRSECYCLSFINAQAKKLANITVGNGKITFVHTGIGYGQHDKSLDIFGVSEGGTILFDVSKDDEKELNDLISRSGRFEGAAVHFRPELGFGRGFTVYVKKPAASPFG